MSEINIVSGCKQQIPVNIPLIAHRPHFEEALAHLSERISAQGTLQPNENLLEDSFGKWWEAD